MRSQKKVKLLLFCAMIIIIALLFTTIYQIVTIQKNNNTINEQNKQISQLEKELEYHNNKSPETNYTPIN